MRRLLTSCLLAAALLAVFAEATPRHERAAVDDAALAPFSCLDLVDGYYADPTTCRMYYVCNAGVPRNLPCQLDTYYDPATSTCNARDLVRCDVPDDPPLFCDDRPDGLYANPADCTGFYQCSGRLTYPTSCTPPLLWNDESRYCDWPRNVACDLTDIFCVHRRHGYYPDPTDCSAYYHCADGKTYRIVCGRGLHWNDAVGGCDFPERANCAITL